MNDTDPSITQGPLVRVSPTRTTALTPHTFAEAVEFANMIAKSTLVPPDFRGKPENILLAIQWGGEIGLSPLQAVQNIAVINGRPSVYGDAMLAIVRASHLCDDVVESIEGAGDNMVAVCVARRLGSAPVVGRFSVADAKAASLWGKAGPWKQYPHRMLQMRARGFALRDAFPDVLRGVISAEEARDIPRGMVDVTPPAATDVAAELDGFATEPVPDSPPVSDSVDTTGDDDEANKFDTMARLQASLGAKAFAAWWNQPGVKNSRDLIRHFLPEYQAIAQAADMPAAPEDPFGLPPTANPRDEDWWAQDRLVVTDGTASGSTPNAFRAQMHRRLREARTVAEVEALRADNEHIDQLPKADKEEVLTALLAREAELKAATQ